MPMRLSVVGWVLSAESSTIDTSSPRDVVLVIFNVTFVAVVVVVLEGLGG